MDDAAAAAAAGVKPARAKPRAKALDQRFFIVGVVWLALAIGLVLYVIVGPPLCSRLQVNTFAAVISLAAGFLAWTFAGKINVKARHVLPGLGIVAGGGFALFVVLFTQFSGDSAKWSDPRCEAVSPEQAAADRDLEQLSVQAANVVQRLTEAKYNAALNDMVFQDALALKTRIDSFPTKHLADIQRTVLAVYGAQAYLALGMTLAPVRTNAGDARAYARRAVDYADAALRGITELMARGDEEGREAVEHFATYKTRERVHYLAGLARVMDAQWAHVAKAAPAFSQEEIATSFREVPATYLREISAATDGPVKWFCSTHSKEVVPCVNL